MSTPGRFLRMLPAASSSAPSSDVMVNLIADDVDTRIAKLILRLGMRYGRRDGRVTRLEIPLTHQEIADMVGTTRQTVTSALSRLKRQGVLTIETRRILIESEELLSDLTHPPDSA